MDKLLYAIILIVLIALVVLQASKKKVVVFEYERGLLFHQGKFIRELEPGMHKFYGPMKTVKKVDIRTRIVSLLGQEILSADNIGIRVSIVCKYKIEDPYKSVVEVLDCEKAIYSDLQTNIRDILGELEIEDFLAKRKEVSEKLVERVKPIASVYGILLEDVSIKDIMFPGDLKRIFAQVVNARKEGLATLERARGESAALRNLANSANLLQKNPGLLQLRLLQTLDNNSGNTIVLGDLANQELITKLANDKNSK